MSQGDYNSPEYWDVVYAGEKSNQWRTYPETTKEILKLLREHKIKRQSDVRPGQCYPWVVDLGCGQGQITAAIARELYHAYGIDHSEEAVEQARERGVAAEQKTIGQWLSEFYFADATVMAEVLEHFTEDDGRRIIQKLAEKQVKLMIFAVPHGVLSPGEHKEHMSSWTITKFVDATPDGYEALTSTFVDKMGVVETPVLLCAYKKRLTEE